jgi:hypothetical protein
MELFEAQYVEPLSLKDLNRTYLIPWWLVFINLFRQYAQQLRLGATSVQVPVWRMKSVVGVLDCHARIVLNKVNEIIQSAQYVMLPYCFFFAYFK